jgi:hypothetical protein
VRFLTLAPAAALALLAGVAAAVMLLYWLKPTPRRLTVSSTLIWRRVLRERKRTPDRLRWWLVAAGLGRCVVDGAAPMRPGGRRRCGKGNVALVLDDSTTLATLTADGKTRWDSRCSGRMRSCTGRRRQPLPGGRYAAFIASSLRGVGGGAGYPIRTSSPVASRCSGRCRRSDADVRLCS